VWIHIPHEIIIISLVPTGGIQRVEKVLSATKQMIFVGYSLVPTLRRHYFACSASLEGFTAICVE
jgi:hypothetical protein